MAINDNWCPRLGCVCGLPHVYSISPYSAWPFPASPPAFPSLPPKCPATTRHMRRYIAYEEGLQCKFEPGHDGDHAAYVGPSEGDVFWPQEAPVTTGTEVPA